MVREVFKNNVPIEWKRRYKAGLCPVCAKTKEEFGKNQRVFCSIKCREEYSSKFMSWEELRQKAFEKYGRKCNKCDMDEGKKRKELDEKQKNKIEEWLKINNDFLEFKRSEELVRLDELFNQRFNEINNDFEFAKKLMPWSDINLYYSLSFEVDHKKAIVNGGDMWDIENLQILCNSCHKNKTAIDLRIRRGKGMKKIISFDGVKDNG